MDERPPQDEALLRLLHLRDEPLDPNTVAAFVDGDLTARELAHVALRLAVDPEALILVLALLAE